MKSKSVLPSVVAGLLVLSAVAWVGLRGCRPSSREALDLTGDVTNGTSTETTLSRSMLPSPTGATGSTNFRSPARPTAPPMNPRQSLALTIEQVMTGDPEATRLPEAQIQAFVAGNRTNAESLLVAFQLSQDNAYLSAAAEAFPDDPRVALHLLAYGDDAPPEQRREWLENFKQSDPGNSLAHYLSARDHLKQGDTASALAELHQATETTDFHEYLFERVQGLEEAYLEAGEPPVEAKLLATFGVGLPYLSQLRDLSQEMGRLEQQFRQAGDPGSAAQMAALELVLANRLQGESGSTTLVNRRVGSAMEREVLDRLDPTQEYGFLDQPVTVRLEQLRSEEEALQETIQRFSQWLPLAPESEVISYLDRLKLYGEPAALQWLQNRWATP